MSCLRINGRTRVLSGDGDSEDRTSAGLLWSEVPDFVRHQAHSPTTSQQIRRHTMLFYLPDRSELRADEGGAWGSPGLALGERSPE